VPAQGRPVSAPIVAVTVHPGRARVTRRTVARLAPGRHRLHIGPLPSALRRESLRVRGRGAATVVGVDLVTTGRPAGDPGLAQLREQRTALCGELAELADADAVEASRADFFGRLGRRAADEYARAVAAGHTDVAVAAAFADSVADQLTAGRARGRQLAHQREFVVERLAAVERRLAEASGRHPTEHLVAAVTLTVPADRGGPDGGCPDRVGLDGVGPDRVGLDRGGPDRGGPAGAPGGGVAPGLAAAELEVSYLVDGVDWESTYDVRLDGGRLLLTWFAVVTQRTGEDWPECDLRLSTAHPTAAGAVPDLPPWYLEHARPAAVPPSAWGRGRPLAVPAAPAAPGGVAGPVSPGGAAGSGGPAAPGGPGAGDGPVDGHGIDGADGARPVGPAGADAEVSAVSYRPPQPVPVSGDGVAHRMTVAVLELPAAVDHVTAPVRAEEAHLRATAVNCAAYPLLPGPAAVFHGPDFLGSTSLPLWSAGEEIELALGVDDRVRVGRELVRRVVTRVALTGAQRRELEYRTTVTNDGPAPVVVTVLDRAPVARHEGITVLTTRLDPEPAERTDLGLLAWRLELHPGARAEIHLGLRVEVARGVELAGWRE
ncbi:MAG TPA: DUF4139 domain-containing protein, partial [Pilimelia sp.]|nr:DUF4139 domain-containing protein [Pilimelia sp.]